MFYDVWYTHKISNGKLPKYKQKTNCINWIKAEEGEKLLYQACTTKV